MIIDYMHSYVYRQPIIKRMDGDNWPYLLGVSAEEVQVDQTNLTV